jgi:hypothetical protein
VSATPCNRYSSIWSPTSHSEGSRPHMTALSPQRTGPPLHKLYTISNSAQNISFLIFSCRRWSYRCSMNPLSTTFQGAREKLWDKYKLWNTAKVSNILLAMYGLVCVCVPVWGKSGNGCSKMVDNAGILFLTRRNL